MKNELRVLLIDYFSDTISEEVGIGFIASLLRSKEITVEMLRLNDQKIDYDRISFFNPHIIGAPVYSSTKDKFLYYCMKLKELLPNCLICAGGYTATYHDVDLMNENIFIDFIVRGEGEITFLELVEKLRDKDTVENIKGLTYRTNDKIARNENRELISNIDILPFPSRDIITQNRNLVAHISTSRGCKSRCGFCVAKDFWKVWRGRSIDKIIDEIKFLKNSGFNYFNFVDSSFEDPDNQCIRLKEISLRLIEENLNISYFADFRAEIYKKIDSDFLKMLVNSGLRFCLIGIESGNDEDLKLYNKIANLQDNYNCLDFFYNHEDILQTNIGFISFNPYSTFNRLNSNLNFLARYSLLFDFNFFLSIYYLTRGGDLFDKIKSDLLLIGNDYDNELNYKFKDETVGEFYHFTSKYVSKIYSESGYNEIIGYFQMVLKLLKDLKYRFNNQSELYQLTKKYENTIKNVMKKQSDSNYDNMRISLSKYEANRNLVELEALYANYINETSMKFYINNIMKAITGYLSEIKAIDEHTYYNVIQMLNVV